MAKSPTKEIDRLVIIILLLVGAGVRLANFGHVPPGLYHDEAQNGLDALRPLQGEFPIYFEANNGREPLFIYLVSISVGVLGRSPFAVRLPSFFIGFLTLAATYNLARCLFNNRTARYALGILAVTFWHIHLSRVAYRANLLPLFTALYLSAICKALQYKKNHYWILGGALYGLSWYSYMAARFTPMAIAVIMVYGVLTHRSAIMDNRREILGNLSRFVLSALLVLLPLGLYTVIHPDIVLTRSGQVSIFNNEINAGNLAGTFIRHTLRSVGMFIFSGDRIWRHNLSYRPVWKAGLSVAFVMGLGLCLASFRKKPAIAVIVLWTAVMLIPTLLAEDAPHYLRAIGVLPTAVLIPALGLVWLQDRIAQWLHFYAPWHLKPFQCLLFQYGLPWFIVASSGLVSTYDYFNIYALSPMTYHWFEAGPVAMAQTINALNQRGWDGQNMLIGNTDGKRVCIDRQLWGSWTAVPFLVPEDSVCFLPDENPTTEQETVYIIWPYGDWRETLLPSLPHPSYIYIDAGPTAQGDLDPEPFTLALYLYADSLPPIPPVIAQFENGLELYAALVEPRDDATVVNLWWGTTQTQTTPSTVFVHYIHEGLRIAQDDGQPVADQLPTTYWIPGNLVLDRHFLPPTKVDTIKDSLRIGLYNSESGDNIPRIERNKPVEPWLESSVILKP